MGSLCVFCGEPNECAMALSVSATGEECWCVKEKFPLDLVERATARDGGASCICRECLRRYQNSTDNKVESA